MGHSWAGQPCQRQTVLPRLASEQSEHVKGQGKNVLGVAFILHSRD